jgi:hypothetical protein
MLVLFVSSCSSIEKATEKWKTPDDPEAGLAPGEKSNYILGKEIPSETKTSRPKKIKKKAIRKR